MVQYNLKFKERGVSSICNIELIFNLVESHMTYCDGNGKIFWKYCFLLHYDEYILKCIYILHVTYMSHHHGCNHITNSPFLFLCPLQFSEADRLKIKDLHTNLVQDQ